MRNIFKKPSKEEEKAKEKKELFKNKKERTEELQNAEVETKAKSEFYDDDEDLGYC
ncbi:MAG: hypothetical protein M3Q56_02805 [Bacteroidota bacterium]|nr:hypothetical protein [Bacteroidota bacterium]